MSENIEKKCLAKGVKLTDQRKIIAKVMSESNDHPDVDELYNRVSKIDPKISIATVYRTVKLFEESGILAKHDFKGGKARYEELNEGHHDHLIDVKSGEIIEFVDEEIEKLQEKIANKYGYRLVDHKLELYGIKKKNMEIKILKPFGPSVVKIDIPQEIMDQMNLFVDEMINNKDKLEKSNEGPNLAGNVYQEFLMDADFMKKIKWGEFIASACNQWIWSEKNFQLKNFQIIKSWIVRQFKNEYNPIHIHSGHISGVGYLKVPKTMGETFQKDKKLNENGKLILIDGSKKLFCSSTYTITPKVGDFYLFPSYLMHTVYPFSGTDEERRSVSFNAKIDEQAVLV